jgi:hypothetical protein
VTLTPGQRFRGAKGYKTIREVIMLSNGWQLIKTDNGKSPRDFLVRTVFSVNPQRSIQPKHAHFAIDFYGKLCQDKTKGMVVFDSIIKLWNGADPSAVEPRGRAQTTGLIGYSLEYILYALKWILEQEDINYTGRSREKQEEINRILRMSNVVAPVQRLGSQLAISLICDIAQGTHPVDAFIRAGLRI